jgi:hypothetical protein
VIADSLIDFLINFFVQFFRLFTLARHKKNCSLEIGGSLFELFGGVLFRLFHCVKVAAFGSAYAAWFALRY